MSRIDIIGSMPRLLQNEDLVYQGTLVYYFRVLIEKATNLQNPYHNLRHMLHVLWLCYQACLEYRGRISPVEMRILLIGAIDHDFDHTGKVGSDSINIARAIAALDRDILDDDRIYFEEISELIRCSEYPHCPLPDTQSNLLAKILRDADMAQVLSSSWIQQSVVGLGQETGICFLEMLDMNIQFLSKLHFETSWARRLFPPEMIRSKIDEALLLRSFLS